MTVELRTALTIWHEAMLTSNAQLETLFKPLDLNPESPVYTLVNSLQDSLTKQTSAIVNDLDGWLDWYRFDNQMGENKMQASSHSKHSMRAIEGLDDLIWLIEESAPNSSKRNDENSKESTKNTFGGVL